MQSIVNLYREARRRKVFRTAALYLLGAWAVLQVADVLFPGFDIPETAIRALVWAAALGFPVAIVFGWLFEVGPSGIRRTQGRSVDEIAEPQPLGRWDYALLAAFLAIAGVLVLGAVQDVRQSPAATGANVEESTADDDSRLPNSIAVLPFTNISSDPENEYFCDGISEEILNEISTVRQVSVIGRTSSFAFKGSKARIEEISAVLGVHYVLQGSVRKAEDRLRISTQLLDERGRQLWAQTFDREPSHVFEIQQEIARAVAARVAREVESRPEAAPHPSLEAYDRYLAGRGLLHKRDLDGAMRELQLAIDLDPGFAEAQAEWAIARLIGLPTNQQLDAAAAAINRALDLKPQLLRAQAARGLLMLQSTPPDAAAAASVLRGVLEQDPNMSDALLWLSNALLELDLRDEGMQILQRASRIDPFHPAIAGNLAAALSERGDDEAALRLLQTQLKQPNPASGIFAQLCQVYRRRGQLVQLNLLAKDLSLRSTGPHFTLALSYALLGDLSTATYWLDQSMQDFPEAPLMSFYGAIAPNWHGDAERARQRFEQGIEAAGTTVGELTTFTGTWYGALLARSGHYSEAIKVLQPLTEHVAISQSLSLDEAPELDGWHALAWSYQHVGERGKAARILSELLDRCQTQMNDRRHLKHSELLHYCAETELMAGDAERALALLERAVESGWREYYMRRNDPYWAALETDPRYRALMATVKADVDRQRMEVESMDATDGFKARLAADQAARRGSSQ